MKHPYTISIKWSEEDQKYVVSLPEFGPYAHTHGDSYEEAVKNAVEVLELLIETYELEGKPLPKPQTLQVA